MVWLTSRWPTLFRQAALASCLFCAATVPTLLHAQPKRYRPAPNYVQVGSHDQKEGKRILEEFRRQGVGVAGQYYQEFQLRVMPRRGSERTIDGRMWGTHNDRGPISRIVLSPEAGAPERRLLIQNGPESAAWSWEVAQAVKPLGISALFERLGGTDLTAFDLEMPFLYWNDFVFEGVTNLRGRPAHVFLLYPPAEVAAQKPELTGVRLYLDTQYNAPVQAEQIGAENRVLKSVSVLDLKKVHDQWILKSLDLRDEETRNKTRFTVTAVALGLDFSLALFDPAMLSETIRAPAPEKIERLGL